MRIELIHAGAGGEPVLREYLGMVPRADAFHGTDQPAEIARTTLLECTSPGDIFTALCDYLRFRRPDLVLTGAIGDHGASQGTLPYRLAQALDYALLPGVCVVSLSAERLNVLQSLSKGRRRKLSAPLPCLLTVGLAAPEPRPFAYGFARRAQIHKVLVPASRAPETFELEPVLLRRLPKRLPWLSARSPRERLDAATRMPAGRGLLLEQATPEQAARALLDYLREARVLDLDSRPIDGDPHEPYSH